MRARHVCVCVCRRLLVLATTISFLLPLASPVVMALLHGGSARGMAGTATRWFAGVTLAACAYDTLAFSFDMRVLDGLHEASHARSCGSPCVYCMNCTMTG